MNITLASRSPTSQQTSAHTILVVEDEPMVRMTIAEYLRDCGYTVLEAGDAQQAMAIVDTDRSVNLVFSDVRMPGPVDGFGLAQWLRRTHPDIAVLLTSGYNHMRSLPPDLMRGTRLIEKPYSQAAVVRTIEDLLTG